MKIKRIPWLGKAAAAAAAVTAAAAYCAYQNRRIEKAELICQNPKVPAVFEGFRISVISGLRAVHLKGRQNKLIDLLKKSEPDRIVIIGGLIENRSGRLQSALTLLMRAARIAPVYYIPGSRETSTTSLNSLFRKALTKTGIMWLENQKEMLYCDGAVVELIGLCDADFFVRSDGLTSRALAAHDALKAAAGKSGGSLRILLSNRPGPAEICRANGVDLALAGPSRDAFFSSLINAPAALTTVILSGQVDEK